jgi:hypothetical protein
MGCPDPACRGLSYPFPFPAADPLCTPGETAPIALRAFLCYIKRNEQ